MTKFSKLQLIIIGLIIVATVYWIIPKGPKFSKDRRIRDRQEHAVELRIFEKAKFLRYNAKELFGWNYWEEIGTANNVTFRGWRGVYSIEYEKLRVHWKDNDYVRLYFNGTRFYEAGIKSTWWDDQVLSSITAFIPGDWIGVFNEMYRQAMKGIPEESDELKEDWGIPY